MECGAIEAVEEVTDTPPPPPQPPTIQPPEQQQLPPVATGPVAHVEAAQAFQQGRASQQRAGSPPNPNNRPILALSSEIVTRMRLELPMAYDALIATDTLYLNTAENLSEKEDELSKCIDVGQDVLGQLQQLQEHCTAQDKEREQILRTLHSAEAKVREERDTIEELRKELAVSESRVKTLTAQAATSFTDPTTVNAIAKVGVLESELDRALARVADAETVAQRESALIKSAEAALRKCEQSEDELRRRLRAVEDENGAQKEQIDRNTAAHLELEKTISYCCEIVSAVQAKRAVLINKFSAMRSPRSGVEKNILRDEYILAERITVPSCATDLKIALQEIDNHYAMQQVIMDKWKHTTDTLRDENKGLKTAFDGSGRGGEVTEQPRSRSGSPRLPVPPLAITGLSAGGTSPRGSARGTPRGYAHSTAALSSKEVAPNADLSKDALRRQLRHAEDRVSMLENKLLEYEKKFAREDHSKVRLIRHEEIAELRFQLRTADETLSNLRLENKRLREALVQLGVQAPLIPELAAAASSASASPNASFGLGGYSIMSRESSAASIPSPIRRKESPHKTVTAESDTAGSKRPVSAGAGSRRVTPSSRAESPIAGSKKEHTTSRQSKNDGGEDPNATRLQLENALAKMKEDAAAVAKARKKLEDELRKTEMKLENAGLEAEMFRTQLRAERDSNASLQAQLSAAAANVPKGGKPVVSAARSPLPLAPAPKSYSQMRQPRGGDGMLSTPKRLEAAAQGMASPSRSSSSASEAVTPPYPPYHDTIAGSAASIIRRESVDQHAAPPIPMGGIGLVEEQSLSLARQEAEIVELREENYQLRCALEENDREADELRDMVAEALVAENGAAELRIQQQEEQQKEVERSARKLQRQQERLRREKEKFKKQSESKQQEQVKAEKGGSALVALDTSEGNSSNELVSPTNNKQAVEYYKHQLGKHVKMIELAEVENMALSDRILQLERESALQKTSSNRDANLVDTLQAQLDEQAAMFEETLRRERGRVETLAKQKADAREFELEHDYERFSEEKTELEQRWNATETALATLKTHFNDYKAKHKLPDSVHQEQEADMQKLRDELAQARRDAVGLQLIADEKENETHLIQDKIEQLLESHEKCRDHLSDAMLEVEALMNHCGNTQRLEAAKLCEYFMDLLGLLREPLLSFGKKKREKRGGAKGKSSPPPTSNSAGNADPPRSVSESTVSSSASAAIARRSRSNKDATRLNEIVEFIAKADNMVLQLREDLRKKEDVIVDLEETAQSCRHKLQSEQKKAELALTSQRTVEESREKLEEQVRDALQKYHTERDVRHDVELKLKRLESDHGMFTREKRAVEDELRTLRDKCNTFQEERVSWNQRHTDIERHHHHALGEAVAATDQAEREKDALQAELTSVRGSLEAAVGQHEAALEAFNQERTSLKQEIGTLAAEVNGYVEHTKVLEKDLANSRTLFDEAQRLIEEVNQTEQFDHSEAQLKVRELEETLAAKNIECEKVQRDYGELLREKEQQKQDMDQARVRFEEERLQMRSLVDISNVTAQAEQHNAVLKRQLEEVMLESAKYKAQLESEMHEKEWLESQVSALTIDKKQASGAAEADRLELIARRTQVEELEKRLAIVERERDPLRNKLQTLLNTSSRASPNASLAATEMHVSAASTSY